MKKKVAKKKPAKPVKKVWKVYMIQATSGAYYTGITTDIARRFSEHMGLGKKAGAKFFHTTKPEKVVYQKRCKNLSEALRREIAIKKLRRPQKAKLCCSTA